MLKPDQFNPQAEQKKVMEMPRVNSPKLVKVDRSPGLAQQAAASEAMAKKQMEDIRAVIRTKGGEEIPLQVPGRADRGRGEFALGQEQAAAQARKDAKYEETSGHARMFSKEETAALRRQLSGKQGSLPEEIPDWAKEQMTAVDKRAADIQAAKKSQQQDEQLSVWARLKGKISGQKPQGPFAGA